MPLLSGAALFVGDAPADRAYLGDTQVWEASSNAPFSVTWDFTDFSFFPESTHPDIDGLEAAKSPTLTGQFQILSSLGYATSPVLVFATGTVVQTAEAAVTAGTYVSFPITCTGDWTPTEITLLAARGGAGTPRGVRFTAPTAPTTLLAGAGDLASARPTFGTVTIPLDIGTITGNASFRMYFYSLGGTSSIEADNVTVSGVLGSL